MSSRNSLWFVMLAIFLSTGGLVSCAFSGGTHTVNADVPIATVERTDLQIEVNITGELRATQAAPISAPAIAGGTLQIVRLLKTGVMVKAGDVLAEFDPSEQEYKLAQGRSDYEQAEQEIVKAKDNAAVQTAQDQTALLKAKFAVRQAELDVSKNEIVSVIDAKKNQLALDEAKRTLAQLEEDIQSNTTSNGAAIAVDEEKANKAMLAMKQAQWNIDNMRAKSPISGLMNVQENSDSSGGIFFSGMSLPDYQEGDQVYPGNVVAQVIDISQMEIAAKVSEKDRGNVKVGQSVQIHIDAIPGKVYQGTVKSVAGMVSGGFFRRSVGHKFDVTIQIDHPDDLLRPSFGAHLVILGDRLQNALCIPRQAIFEKDGKPSVYVKTGNSFEHHEIRVQNMTEGLAVIDGLKEGTQVALVDFEKRSAAPANPAASTTPSFGSTP
jgi:HlyD family secretion protein